MKSTWHRSSTEAIGLGYCWRRFVACTSVASPLEHVWTYLFGPQEDGTYSHYWLETFHYWTSISHHFFSLSPSVPNMYPQRYSILRSMEAVIIDTSWRSHHGLRCLSPSALNGNYYEYSLGCGQSWSDRRKPSLKPSIDVC